MRSWIGLGGGAVVVVALLAIGNAAAAAAPASRRSDVTQACGHRAPATDLSARRRAHRHVGPHRTPIAVDVRPHYYARPYYYRPDGIAPFFPFRYGYGTGSVLVVRHLRIAHSWRVHTRHHVERRNQRRAGIAAHGVAAG